MAISKSIIGILSLFAVATSVFAASGEATFKPVCKACHASGVMGAPKYGNSEDQSPRVAQGMNVLEENAIKGFKEKKGIMPAKGGRSSLSDDEVKAAVAYMVNGSK